jgi:FOG: Ankyrin repeat
MNFGAGEQVSNKMDIDIDPKEESVAKAFFEEKKESEAKYQWLLDHGCKKDVARFLIAEPDELGRLFINHEIDLAFARNILSETVNYVNSGQGFFGQTPFRDAVFGGNFKISQLLSPYVKDETINHVEGGGDTVLFWACLHNRLDIVKLIINRCTKETVNTFKNDDGGWTPLTWACVNNNFEIVKLLLPRCTNETINKIIGHRKTTLTYAIIFSSLEIIKLLLQNSANFDEESKEILIKFKESPDKYNKRREVVEYFESKEYRDLREKFEKEKKERIEKVVDDVLGDMLVVLKKLL